MKKYGTKLTAGLLTVAMTASSLTPAFAAPANTAEGTESSSEIVLSQTAQDNLAAARIIGSMGNMIESTENEVQEETPESKLKDAIKNWIFNGYDGSLDLSRFGITSEEMDNATAEVLDETGMEDAADVTYETDDEGQVTIAEVEMDPMIVMAAEELKTVYNLSEEQSQELLGMYAQYLQLCEDNADIFGVQVPYNTTRDTNSSPIGSLLDIASIPEEYAQAGGIDYATLSGIVQLYYLGTQFAVNEYADEIKAGRDSALKVLEDGMTEMQEYLALNDWLADNCQFAMDYIMPEMVEPEPAENQLYTYAYNCMYNMIKQQVYDGTYNALKDVYGEDQAKAIATQQSEAFMVDVQEEGGSGEQQAASTASAIVGMWGSNPVGVFVNKKAVCFGYANVYAYLQQCAHPEIYLKDPSAGLDDASNWKSYKELNYELDKEGNPVKDEDGNYKWSKDSAAMVDYVKIIFDADVTMFGQDSSFGECHYWNAVKLDGKWYYVDPCYVDIYIECMNRDRVETDGNLNHLYFMFSDDSCREMYKDNFKEIRTLYKGIATDPTYEESWVAFVKSQPYKVGDKIYYLYDSTDLLDVMRNYGNGSSSGSRAADNNGSATDYEGLFTDTEYKIVYHTNAMGDTSADFFTLIDFNNGQVYVPGTDGAEGSMTDNALLAELYAEHKEYVKEYPSISISCSYYNGKIYFSLSNCILSYDINTGNVEKLIEYTEVSGKRDMSKGLGGLAFTMTSGDPGTNGITVKNPPIADMTIKKDGNMYVSVATNYAFISGKDFGQLKDYSSYGYQFAETNYEPSYNTYYNNSEPNDNDEFMWSANIVGTIDMSHLAGTSHSYKNVTVPASCTENEYTVSRCSECGLIQETTTVEDEAETVNDGEETEDNDVTEEGEDQAEEKTNNLAVLNITVKASDEENAQIIASTTLTAKEEVADDTDEPTNEAEATPYTFSGDEISKAVKTLSLPEGYGIPEDYNAADVSVAYGESGQTSVIAVLTGETAPVLAALNIEVTAGDAEGTQIIASATLTESKKTSETDEADTEENDEEDASFSFTVEKINETIDGFEVDGYIIPDYEGEEVSVNYGESGSVQVAATEETVEEAVATIEIKVYDSATKDDEEPTIIAEETVTENGTKGDKLVYSPEQIVEKVKAKVEEKGYALDGQPEEDTVAVYGGEPVPVELTATEIPTGDGHTYIKFNETYYTKDSNGSWQTGTSYVCINCGHAFELEDDETVEDHLRSNDKVLTDDEVKSYAGNTTKVWTWSTDKTEASMYTVPTDLKDRKFDCIWENPSLSSREVATVSGDCTDGKFTAKLSNGETSTASVTAGKHSYQNQEEKDKATQAVTQEAAVQWTWDNKCTTATATFKCDVCGKTLEKTVKQADMESSETEDGLIKYTATVTVDDVKYISSRVYDPNPFEDVSKDDYYYDAVLWAVENNITVGKDDTHFAPGAACTRAQVVTFLWRTMDEPEPETTENPFVDVTEDDYYYKAVLWASENGITVGKDDTHFAPGATVTRAQFVAFLHRNEGEPKPKTTENPFVDVNESDYYYNAVLWAYENEITVGKDDTHFAPKSSCTRAQVVTFLYRAYGDEE